jgi:ribosome-binding protein aMBF1 (putative translation factor)
MNAPVCSTCAQEQRGIVHFFWSEGAVVYECRQCGAFNEVGDPRLAASGREVQQARRPAGSQSLAAKMFRVT